MPTPCISLHKQQRRPLLSLLILDLTSKHTVVLSPDCLARPFYESVSAHQQCKRCLWIILQPCRDLHVPRPVEHEHRPANENLEGSDLKVGISGWIRLAIGGMLQLVRVFSLQPIIGQSSADVWQMWPVLGQCLANFWPMSGQCLADVWPLCGQWLANVWPMSGQCLANGWQMLGQCLANVWPMAGQ